MRPAGARRDAKKTTYLYQLVFKSLKAEIKKKRYATSGSR